MSFGELFSHLLGWLGNFVDWLTKWCPRYRIVRFNEAGVMYPRGRQPRRLAAGVHWYVPNLSEIRMHPTGWFTLEVEPLTLETKDAQRVSMGIACEVRIVDVLKYEVENFDADKNVLQSAKGALREAVMSQTWADLVKPVDDDSRLGGKLQRRMAKTFTRFGMEVEMCQPTDQVRMGHGVYRLFGMPRPSDSIGPTYFSAE